MCGVLVVAYELLLIYLALEFFSDRLIDITQTGGDGNGTHLAPIGDY